MASDLLDRDGSGQGGQTIAGAQDQIDTAWKQRMVAPPDRYEVARQAVHVQHRRLAQSRARCRRNARPVSNEATWQIDRRRCFRRFMRPGGQPMQIRQRHRQREAASRPDPRPRWRRNEIRSSAAPPRIGIEPQRCFVIHQRQQHRRRRGAKRRRRRHACRRRAIRPGRAIASSTARKHRCASGTGSANSRQPFKSPAS